MKFLGALMVLRPGHARGCSDGASSTGRARKTTPSCPRRRQTRSRPALIFFTSKGCSTAHVSDGAFSDPAVVEAREAFVCVFVECDWGFKNVELARRFKVTGYPVVVVCNPQGEDAGVVQSDGPRRNWPGIEGLSRQVRSQSRAARSRASGSRIIRRSP